MRGKKGFTLIELLAIIVILAIIAVITVPIILNIIDNSKRGTATDSAYGYKDAVNKFYVTKLSSDPTYNIPDGDYTTEQLKSMGLSISGKEPANNSRLTITKNDISAGCLQFDEYKVEIKDGKVGNAEKGECHISGDFVNDSWSKIKETLAIDSRAYDGEIGKIKTVTMNLDGTNKEYNLMLVNTSRPDICETDGFSQTACGFVVMFTTSIGGYPIESDSDGPGHGWNNAYLRNVLNTSENSIYSKLPDDLKSAIILTNPVVSGSESHTYNTTSDYLYLLASKELGKGDYENEDDFTYDTRTLDYYQNKTEIDCSYSGWMRTVGYGGYFEAYCSSDHINVGVIDTYMLNPIGNGDYEKVYTTSGVKPVFRIY